jgi:H+/Cl- antiporter ClcA
VRRFQLVVIALAILLSPLVYWCVALLWSMTSAFHGEVIQRVLMGLGDVREPTVWERVGVGLVWIPLVLVLALVGSLYGYAVATLIRIVRSRPKPN